MALQNACMTVASAPGTGCTIALGSVYSIGGFSSFDTAGAVNGTIIQYAIIDGQNLEYAIGTYTSAANGGPSLTRSTISSFINGVSHGTAPLNLSANSIITGNLTGSN